MKYLAPYVGRTAISDERIVAASDDVVTFTYTDSATQQRKLSTVSAAEFMRRYLQHVPPPGQHRVRYFGWMHPSAKARRMKIETLLAKPIVVSAAPPTPPAWHLRCPHCAHFTLVRRHVAAPGARTAALSPMTPTTNPHPVTRTLRRLMADSDRFARRLRLSGKRPRRAVTHRSRRVIFTLQQRPWLIGTHAAPRGHALAMRSPQTQTP